MPRIVWVAAALAVVVVVAGAAVVTRGGGANRRDVLTAGFHLGNNRTAHRVDDAEAVRMARRTYLTWRAELRHRAVAAPHERFDNPSPRAFEASLRQLARRDGFHVVSSTLFQPRQRAPAVVVSTSAYERLSRETGAILHVLDPKRATNDDRTGWRWEGFFFEAVDERGVPFLATFNFWRGQHVGGGQWARSDALFPFPHG